MNISSEAKGARGSEATVAGWRADRSDHLLYHLSAFTLPSNKKQMTQPLSALTPADSQPPTPNADGHQSANDASPVVSVPPSRLPSRPPSPGGASLLFFLGLLAGPWSSWHVYQEEGERGLTTSVLCSIICLLVAACGRLPGSLLSWGLFLRARHSSTPRIPLAFSSCPSLSTRLHASPSCVSP